MLNKAEQERLALLEEEVQALKQKSGLKTYEFRKTTDISIAEKCKHFDALYQLVLDNIDTLPPEYTQFGAFNRAMNSIADLNDIDQGEFWKWYYACTKEFDE